MEENKPEFKIGDTVEIQNTYSMFLGTPDDIIGHIGEIVSIYKDPFLNITVKTKDREYYCSKSNLIIPN